MRTPEQFQRDMMRTTWLGILFTALTFGLVFYCIGFTVKMKQDNERIETYKKVITEYEKALEIYKNFYGK